MTDIAKRLREIAAALPDDCKKALLGDLMQCAAELESQPAGDPAMPVVAEVKLGTHNGAKWITTPAGMDALAVGPLVRQSDALAAIAAARQERVPTPRFDHNWLTGQPASTPEEIEAWRRQQLQGPALDWSGT